MPSESEIYDKIMDDQEDLQKRVRIQVGTIVADALQKRGDIDSDEIPGFVKAVTMMTDDEAGQFTDRLSEEIGL